MCFNQRMIYVQVCEKKLLFIERLLNILELSYHVVFACILGETDPEARSRSESESFIWKKMQAAGTLAYLCGSELYFYHPYETDVRATVLL